VTLEETEQGRMSLWDKCLTAALSAGKDINEALAWAEKATTAFEDRFHAVVKDAKDALDHIAS